MTCRDLSYFLCWTHPTLAQYAADATAEIKALESEKRILLDALRLYYIADAPTATHSSAQPTNLVHSAGAIK